MKIKQELIDKLTSSDWTREKLAEELLIARFQSHRNQAEAHWLDQLADMLRDDEGDEEQERIFAEYNNRITDLMDTYRDRANEGK